LRIFEFIDFASLALAALEMTLQTAENLANGIYQPLPPLPFDDTRKSALAETFTDVSPSTMRVNNCPLDPPKFEESECEQTSKLVDNFYSYVTDPANGSSFRNHSLATRHSESCEFSNS